MKDMLIIGANQYYSNLTKDVSSLILFQSVVHYVVIEK